MNVTLSIPVEWLRELHPRYEDLKASDSQQRRMVTELLYACEAHFGACKIAPAPAPAAEAHCLRVPLYLTQRLARFVASVARESELMPGAAAKALLHKLWLERPSSVESAQLAAPSPLAELLQSMGGRETRPEQIAAFSAIEDALTSGRVGLVEASTGVGKTLASLFAATRWALKTGGTCCLTTPTLALVRQFIAEYRQLASAMQVPLLLSFFGRREFVSQLALAELLQDRPELASPEVLAWVARGGTPAIDDGIEPNWLIDELRAIAPEFPLAEVSLGELTTPEDAGMKAYRSQFSQPPSEPALLLCTHAMLAQDMRLRLRRASRDEEFSAVNAGIIELLVSIKGLDGDARGQAIDELIAAKDHLHHVLQSSESITGLLPAYRALVADEAHVLEQNFSSALSEYLPLQKVLRRLIEYKTGGGKVPSQAITDARATLAAIQAGAPSGEFVALASTTMVDSRAALARFLLVLEGVVSVKPRNPPLERQILLAELKRAANLIRLALNAGQARAYVRLSPSRSYPQLYVGRDNVESVLQTMWGTVAAGAAVSATLYLYRAGGPHGGYSGGLLGIPDLRRAEYNPVEAPWLVEPIALIDVPSGERAQRLRPPSRLDRLTPEAYSVAMSNWLDAVADELIHIHSTAAGGVLVLNTSYEVAHGLAERLAPLDAVTVCAKEGRSLSRQAAAFLTLRDAGQKPIWLAVGGAWTGLDLGGHEPMSRLIGKEPIPAALDTVLTDLVIPRLPFGTNNSITHLRRTLTKPSVPWDLLDAAFRFRQGLGRLVRRKGLPRNRRIWVLDGRLSDTESGSGLAVFWAPIERLRNRMAAIKVGA